MTKLLPLMPVILLVAACTGATSGTSVVMPTRTVSFASDVAPLVQRSCASCHGTGDAQGGVSLCDASGKAVYSAIKAWAASIASEVSSGRMPRDGALSGTDRGLIQGWVDQGALDN